MRFSDDMPLSSPSVEPEARPAQRCGFDAHRPVSEQANPGGCIAPLPGGRKLWLGPPTVRDGFPGPSCPRSWAVLTALNRGGTWLTILLLLLMVYAMLGVAWVVSFKPRRVR